jgi:hypothetical protein
MYSTFQPTKRDLVLVLSVFFIFGILLQFDLQSHVEYFRSRTGSAAWDTARIAGGKHGKLIDDVKSGAKASEGSHVASMTEGKVKWGEEGAPRTDVLIHAPGMRYMCL